MKSPKAKRALVPVRKRTGVGLEEGPASEMLMVRALKVDGSLAIVHLPDNLKRYSITITEGPSAGYNIQPDGMNLTQAKAMLKRLAPLTDWSKLDQNGGNLSAKARETLRAAVFIIFEELGLRPKGQRIAAYEHKGFDRRGNRKAVK